MQWAKLVVAAAWLLGGAAMVIGATHGHALGIFISLPVICTSWVFARGGAAVSAVVCLPFTMLCLALGGLDPFEVIRTNVFIPIGHGVAAIVGFMLGYLQALRRRLELETTLRIEIERAKLAAEMEAQLLRADRLATIGTMAAAVAHEINNPLTYVIANLELAREDLEGAGTAASAPASWQQQRAGLLESLAEARAGAERIRDIVAELKLFTRARDDDGRGVDLVEVLETSIKMCRHELGSTIELELELADVPAIRGDGGKLTQVFINLIVNAVQAMPSERGHGLIGVKLAQLGDEVVVTVSDDGIGMSEEVQRRAFDPFFTTKPVGVGTGLGLAVCADIIRDHQGRLELDSELGRGTTFRIRLPIDFELESGRLADAAHGTATQRGQVVGL